MNKMIRLTIICLLFHFSLNAQEQYLVHSHNDYKQELPFWYAYSNGATSIEVDVFLKDQTLFVTHSEDEISESATLESVYLDRLNALLLSGELRELQLLIDFKSEAYTTINKLVDVLKEYPALLKSNKIRFVISGNKPKSEDYIKYPDYIMFDHQNLNNLEEIDLSKVALISANYKDYSVWNGYGRMVASEAKQVKNVIEKAHNISKPIRFWATPDTKTAWLRLSNLGVNYINTDKPALANQYIKAIEKNTYHLANKVKTYQPKYDYDEDQQPQNIILMIGDGNGLAQISATMIANRGELTVTKIKNIGLIKTASEDNLITDSAAGATAMATGVKTNNRAIGVDSEGKKLNNLINITKASNFNTAIVSTDAIYGATPSSFFAHRTERDDTKGLVTDLKGSKLDFFIAGGRNQEKNIEKEFKTERLETFSDFDGQTAIYIGEEKAPTMSKGRENTFPTALKKALKVLDSKEKPFFLMAEGAQIDNGGHSNNIKGIIEEMLDFDQAIAEALRFADANKNTLVLITADHETSGLGIVGGNIEGTVQADFLTVDHTGIMVPLFAYGPQADKFTGIYENTMIFKKILEVLAIKTLMSE